MTKAEKDARLAAALRDNLRKRKAASRPSDTTTDEPSGRSAERPES